MAPEKNLKRRLKIVEKEMLLWPNCKKSCDVPSSFISLHSVNRNFGISAKDLKPIEIRQVVYSSRCGQFGYFLPPELVNAIKARLPSKVPGGWLSESYLTRCLERKGGEEKGTVKSFRSKWAREGVREGTRGGYVSWWFPPSFLTQEMRIAIILNRDSVVFKDDQKYKDVGLMTGIDITSPPTIPRPFLVKKGGASDIVVASEDNSDEEEESADDDEDDELNTARFDENDNDEKSKENNPVSDVGDC